MNTDIPLFTFPKEIVLDQIFPNVNANDLIKYCLVDKEWNSWTSKSLENKSLEIYKDERLITPAIYNKIYSGTCISAEEELEAKRTLPPNLKEIGCPRHSGKKLIDTHLIFWMPGKVFEKDVSIGSYGKLCLIDKYKKGGYKHCSTEISEKVIRTRSERGWFAITKRSLDEGVNKDYKTWKAENRGIAPYQDIPFLTGIIAFSMMRFNYDQNAIHSIYLRCKDNGMDEKLGLLEGNKGGFFLSSCKNRVDTKLYGLMNLPYRPITTISLLDELYSPIISHLDVQTLHNCYSVSHNFQKWTTEIVHLKKKALYENPLVFGPKALNALVKENGASAKEEEEAIAKIPLNLFEMSYLVDGISTKIMDENYYVWIPKEFDGKPFYTYSHKTDLLQKIYLQKMGKEALTADCRFLNNIDITVRVPYGKVNNHNIKNGYWKPIPK